MAPRPESLEMIRRLVAFDTTSRNSNLDLIAFVQDYLDGFGIRSQLMKDDTGQKANLYATIGPDDRAGYALSGHTDVVPVDGQDWSSDPWTVREADGRLYGRGTTDMKGFVAAVLNIVPKLTARELSTPVHLLFSYDEEVGCLGVRKALEVIKDFPVKPKGCVIGEPTAMKVAIAHKGKKSLRCHVHGFECHSSLAPQGVNAVEYAAEVIGYLKRMGRRFAKEGPFDHDYDVPHTTVHTGIVKGGTALNIVPKDCSFDFEFRYLPMQKPDDLVGEVKRFAEQELLREMRSVNGESGFSWEPISAFPGLDTAEDAEITVIAKALTQANDTIKIAFGTEGGLIQQIDIPTVICGPGSIEQAHKPDEWVALDQIAQCEAFLERLVAKVSA
ncbi:acetylornithine deacetylase [Dongia mobilis]|uniref:Acetylornithine deacetylase n=1 Tax=Dongia mobilis TaxID=578943 RepID=A0A4R6WN79_9PROT|nr:acetylornithine deacetylase [Dongia mobilis]TDQ80619.1 acetylornithine deacetylase [Dongia mobilis]